MGFLARCLADNSRSSISNSLFSYTLLPNQLTVFRMSDLLLRPWLGTALENNFAG